MKALLFVIFWAANMQNIDQNNPVLLVMKDDYKIEYDDIEDIIFLEDDDLELFLDVLTKRAN